MRTESRKDKVASVSSILRYKPYLAIMRTERLNPLPECLTEGRYKPYLAIMRTERR